MSAAEQYQCAIDNAESALRLAFVEKSDRERAHLIALAAEYRYLAREISVGYNSGVLR